MSWNPFGSSTPSASNTAPSTTGGLPPKQVYYLGIFRPVPGGDGRKSEKLVSDENLAMVSSFLFTAYNQSLQFSTLLIAERTPVGQRQKVLEKGLAFYAYNTSFGFCVVLVTKDEKDDDKNYDLGAGSILSKTADAFKSAFPLNQIRTSPASTFKWPQIAQLRKDAEDVHLKGISAVQRDLDETKMVLHDTIEKVLQRGEKLDDLVAKSDQLGTLSKGFYKQSKAQNSCCVVM